MGGDAGWLAIALAAVARPGEPGERGRRHRLRRGPIDMAASPDPREPTRPQRRYAAGFAMSPRRRDTERIRVDGCIQVGLNVYGGVIETFQIAELARRTGLSRPTLRYYEEIGLLDEPERSEAGYRVYNRDDEARLQFIRRAKRLGLSLEEIRDLVAVWAGGECATTRRQLRELVERKITAVREQVEDCVTFLRQLEAVNDRLMGEPEASDGCACVPELPHVNLVQLGPDLSISDTAACTCGGSCGGACSCGCACCERNVELSEDPDTTMEEGRDRREHQCA